jgi:hypothetical protein
MQSNTWGSVAMKPLRKHGQFPCGVLGSLTLIEHFLQLGRSKGGRNAWEISTMP